MNSSDYYVHLRLIVLISLCLELRDKLIWHFLEHWMNVMIHIIVAILGFHSRDETAMLVYKKNVVQVLQNRELKQPRRRRQQNLHKFAYFTMKNNIFARFARAFFIFWHFEDVLVLSMTWNDLFCSCVDGESIWWQMLIFVFLCPSADSNLIPG